MNDLDHPHAAPTRRRVPNVRHLKVKKQALRGGKKNYFLLYNVRPTWHFRNLSRSCNRAGSYLSLQRAPLSAHPYLLGNFLREARATSPCTLAPISTPIEVKAQVVNELASPVFVNVPHGHAYVNLKDRGAAIIVVVAHGVVIETRCLGHIARLPKNMGVLRGTCLCIRNHATVQLKFETSSQQFKRPW